MKPLGMQSIALRLLASCLLLGLGTSVGATDKALLDVLLENGAITQAQYDKLLEKEEITAGDVIVEAPPEDTPSPPEVADETKAMVAAEVDRAVERVLDEEFSVSAAQGGKGFSLSTKDGNWQTNLQWRAQMRYTNPFFGDPRQLSNFDAPPTSNFEMRRLRMKIGGHGFQPWLKYYFEVDLQPSRDPDSSSASSSARVIDWRVDVAKWDWGGLRVGQWKIDYNRERVDSSGRQQFVERSIVNRIFTIDRQVGIQLRGRAFKETPADFRWYAGVFNGEGRGVRNTNESMMYVGRLQWNFLGRDLSLRQTDVEFTEKPTGSFALGASTTEGRCTRWSSSGCGNLDGFASPALALEDQFKVEQAVQEFAFKYRGFSVQQEFHRKFVSDRVADTRNDLTGGYLQSGYFFHNLVPAVPAPLELGMRYAYVQEPNRTDRSVDNEREEYSLVANWFFAGHNNKLTFDYSYLTLDDGLAGFDDYSNRVRLQWDVSF